MDIRPSISNITDEITYLRRELHQNPQTAFEENFANSLICEKLTEWQIPFHSGLGKTGVVATIKGNKTGPSIGLRADIDALDITEVANKDWASKTPGKMHGCGHDGHTAIMLGVAKTLSQNLDFAGTVHIIFQPAEEIGQGAKAMMADGLFERFPCDEIYALHNWSSAPLGEFHINMKESMACVDRFEFTVHGRGGHAARPHAVVDPIIIGAQISSALQTLISRETDPLKAAVLSITNFNSGTGAFNVIPDKAVISGTVRTYCKDLRNHLESRIEMMASTIAKTYGAEITYQYDRFIDATINHEENAQFCADIARVFAGEDQVFTNGAPSMGGEDFGAFLEHVKGAYVKIGQADPNDPKAPVSQSLHNAAYDFNDQLIPIAIEYFTRLVETRLKN